LRRRRLLAGAALLGACAPIGRAGATLLLAAPDADDLAAARAIAAAYCRRYPQDLAAIGAIERHFAGDSRLLAAWAAAARAEDLAKGEVVLVEGWIMARSEARWCVLRSRAGER
jgi:hypothetical protein